LEGEIVNKLSAVLLALILIPGWFCRNIHAARAASTQVSPLNLPLVEPSNFSLTFLGSFKIPQGSGSGTFSYGGEAMSVSGTTMYVGGMYYYNGGSNNVSAIGAVQIPTLSGVPAYDGSNGTASIVTQPVVPVDGSGNPSINCGQAASKTNCVFQGTLLYQGKLYISVAPFYDTTNGANGFLMGANPDLSGWGNINAAATACLSGTPVRCTQRYFAGVLGVVPSIWQQYLGGPCYEASGPSLSIESNAINGFGFSTFNCSAYSPSGGAVTVNEALDYYYGGVTPREPDLYSLSYRSFSGPFPLGGGGGCSESLTSNPQDGATGVTFSTPFAGCDSAALDGPYQVTFSDGETRLVHLTNGNSSAPDGLYTCNYGVTGCKSFPALTGCPSAGCASSVVINPMGDNYFSEYDGPMGYAFIVPGSRSLLYVSLHEYGPSGRRGTGCDANASGSNDSPVSPDTENYRRVQITAYDLDQLYDVHEGKLADYEVTPYAFWEFPNWRVAANATGKCATLPGDGSFFFDPTTDILYGTFSSNDYGYGHSVVDEWRVNSLGPTPSAPSNVLVN
jgi:hypothetical protein